MTYELIIIKVISKQADFSSFSLPRFSFSLQTSYHFPIHPFYFHSHSLFSGTHCPLCQHVHSGSKIQHTQQYVSFSLYLFSIPPFSASFSLCVCPAHVKDHATYGSHPTSVWPQLATLSLSLPDTIKHTRTINTAFTVVRTLKHWLR